MVMANSYGVYDPASAFKRDSTLAQNAYTRFLAQQRGARQVAEIDRTRTSGLDNFASSFARRGLRNSGIYEQAQNTYATDWMQQSQTALDRLYEELRASNYGDANAWADFGNSAANAETEKMMKILETAASLSSLKLYTGGS